MATVDDLVREERAELRRRERERILELVAAYLAGWVELRLMIEQFSATIEAERAAGRSVFAATFELGRMERLEREIARRLAEASRVLRDQVVAEQRAVARLGARHALALAEAVAERDIFRALRTPAPPGRLSTTAIERIEAALEPGTALQRLLESIGPAGWRQARDAIIESVAMGRNPRETARAVRDALGSALGRAMTISRTEVLRAYRQAAIAQYAEIPGVTGWVWVAALDGRTCAMCWSMHNTWHPLDEPFATHPNCRCSAAPTFQQPDPDGYVRGGPFDGTGPERFAGLGQAEQLAILGPSKFQAFNDGWLKLPDLVQDTDHPDWGPGRREATLLEAAENSTARERAPAPAPPKPPPVSFPAVAPTRADSDPGTLPDLSGFDDTTPRGRRAMADAIHEWMVDELGMPPLASDITQLAVRGGRARLEPFVEELARLVRAYPGIADRIHITTKVPWGSRWKPNLRGGEQDFEIGINYSVEAHPNVHGEPGWALPFDRSDTIRGVRGSEDSWQTTLVHEFGHLFEERYPVTGWGANWKDYAARLQSRYGRKNHMESFAEWWAAHWWDETGKMDDPALLDAFRRALEKAMADVERRRAGGTLT